MALGLSQTQLMSDSSNIECIQETSGIITAYTSWMLIRSGFREGIDQTIIELLQTRFIDGRIYCRIQRETVTVVNEKIFDLENDDHYLLIASGTQLREDSVGVHGPYRGATVERISLNNPLSPTEPPITPPATPPTPPTDGSIYDGCDTLKLCFGFPSSCISPRNCQLLTTIKKINEEFFEFEMLSMCKNQFLFLIYFLKFFIIN